MGFAKSEKEFIEQQKQQLINEMADKLHIYEMMLRSGKCNGWTFKTLRQWFLAINLFFDSWMDYEDAGAITDMSLSAMTAAMSRNSKEKTVKKSMFLFSSLMEAIPRCAEKLKNYKSDM